MEALDDVPGLYKVWQPLFDGGNRHRLSLGQVVAVDGHQANDGARGGSIAESAFSLFCSPSSRCPFGDNTQASAKTGQSKLPPQFGAITQSSIPLRFKPRQVRFERGLPDPEDVGPLTTNDTADQLSAMPSSAHDFLDGDTISDEPADYGICLFTPQISLVLQPLSGSQQFRIYGCSADRHPDLPHRFTNSVEKSVAGVFHQMPTVGDLICVWESSCDGLRISTATVSCDDLDLGLLDQPGLGGRLFPVGQQCDCPSAFKIANDGAVSMIASPGPVINADDARWQEALALHKAVAPQEETTEMSMLEQPQHVDEAPIYRIGVKAPLSGMVMELCVKTGDRISRGDVVAIMESMKMEQSILAENEGVVAKINVEIGAFIETGDDLMGLD